MTVELGFPTDAYLIDPVTPGDESESSRAVAADGTTLYHTYWLGTKLTYQVQLCLADGTDPETSYQRSKIKAWRQHLRNKHYGNYARFWVREVDKDSSTHMLCGFGDGSTTTFPIPVSRLNQLGTDHGGDSDFAIFVDSGDGPAYQNSGITTFETWNLNTLSSYGIDQVCSFSDGDEDGYITINSATLAVDRSQSLDGMYSGKVTGASANAGIRTESSITVSESQEYTATAHCKGDGTVRTRLVWYAAGSPNGTDDSDSVVLSDDAWAEVSVTATAPASTDGVRIQIYRLTTTSTPFWVDMIGLNPGASSRVWVPSASPGVVVFSSAPTSGYVISASGYGHRMVPVREDADKGSWPLDVAGQPQMSLRVTEEFPLPV